MRYTRFDTYAPKAHRCTLSSELQMLVARFPEPDAAAPSMPTASDLVARQSGRDNRDGAADQADTCHHNGPKACDHPGHTQRLQVIRRYRRSWETLSHGDR